MGRKKLKKSEQREQIAISIVRREIKLSGGKKQVQQILQEKWNEHRGFLLTNNLRP